jgi:hypothetical protein
MMMIRKVGDLYKGHYVVATQSLFWMRKNELPETR